MHFGFLGVKGGIGENESEAAAYTISSNNLLLLFV
jgi:hypothetical protein